MGISRDDDAGTLVLALVVAMPGPVRGLLPTAQVAASPGARRTGRNDRDSSTVTLVCS